MKKVVSLILVMVLGLSGLAESAFSTADGIGLNSESDIEMELNALVSHYSKYNSGSNPLIVPFGEGEGKYTNSLKFIQHDAARRLGRNPSEIAVGGNTSIMRGTVAPDTPLEYDIQDKEGNLTSSYNPDDKKPAIAKLSFTMGGKTVTLNKPTFLKVPAKKLSAEEKVELEASTFNWENYKAENERSDYLIHKVKATSMFTGLPKAPFLYKGARDGVNVSYMLEYKGEGEDPGALKLKPTYMANDFEIKRPQVGEESAEYAVKAYYSSKENPQIKREASFAVKVPALKASYKRLRLVPADAALEITDPMTSKWLPEKYIARNGEFVILTLHKDRLDKNMLFPFKFSKQGYLAKTGRIVANDDDKIEEYKLEATDERDNQLESIELTEPEENSASVKKKIGNITPDRLDYDLEVGRLDKVSMNIKTAKAGAKVEVRYFASVKDADKGEEAYSQKTLTSDNGRITCSLASKGETRMRMRVVPAEGSPLSPKTYTLNIKKDINMLSPFENMDVDVEYEDGGRRNTTQITKEEVFSPKPSQGGIAPNYKVYVNHDASKVKFKFLPYSEEEIARVSVGDEQLIAKNSGYTKKAYVYEFSPFTGNNVFKVDVVTMDGKTYTYNITLIKKKNFAAKNVEIKDGIVSVAMDKWNAGVSIPQEARSAEIRLSGLKEDVDVYVDDEAKSHIHDEWLHIDMTKDGNLLKNRYVKIRTVSEGQELDYSIAIRRLGVNVPNSVEHYLPAPGIYTNDSSHMHPGLTLSGRENNIGLNLGGYGGSVIYKFDEPLQDNPANPYGVDFLIFGDAAYEEDAEPGAVMVSEDGKNWYELAGSRYYDKDVKHNVKMTYFNLDADLDKPANVAWQSDDGDKGEIIANPLRTAPYYPIPKLYERYNKLAGTEAFTRLKAEYQGGTKLPGRSLLKDNKPRYGYADVHPDKLKSGKAANPYRKEAFEGAGGDGFDLSWAVDQRGRPVSTSGKRFKFVKIYNCVQQDTGKIGEVSPDIRAVERVKPEGVSQESPGLTKLTLNGKEIDVAGGKRNHTFGLKDGEMLEVKAQTEGKSNILIGDSYVESGEAISLDAGRAIRIAVQQEENLPVFYYIELKRPNDPPEPEQPTPPEPDPGQPEPNPPVPDPPTPPKPNKPKVHRMKRGVYHAGEKVRLRLPSGKKAEALKWKSSDRRLLTVYRGKINLKAPGAVEVRATDRKNVYIYPIIIKPKKVGTFKAKKKGKYVLLSWKPAYGSDGVWIYKAVRRRGRYSLKMWLGRKNRDRRYVRLYLKRGERYAFGIKAYKRIKGKSYLSKFARTIYIKR